MGVLSGGPADLHVALTTSMGVLSGGPEDLHVALTTSMGVLSEARVVKETMSEK